MELPAKRTKLKLVLKGKDNKLRSQSSILKLWNEIKKSSIPEVSILRSENCKPYRQTQQSFARRLDEYVIINDFSLLIRQCVLAYYKIDHIV